MNRFYALSHGLFEANAVPVNKVAINDYKGKTYNDAILLYESTLSKLPADSWINLFDDNQDQSTDFIDTPDPNKIDDQFRLLQGKDTNLKNYNNDTDKTLGVKNRFANEMHRKGLPANYISDHFEPIEGTAGFVNTGGAIGTRVAGKKDDVLRIWSMEYDDIVKAMGNLAFHPISACPKLAEAFRKSGLHNYFKQLLASVQSMNTEYQQNGEIYRDSLRYGHIGSGLYVYGGDGRDSRCSCVRPFTPLAIA